MRVSNSDKVVHMFFALSKILSPLAVPSSLFIIIGIVGIALLPTRYRATGRRLVVASLILIAAIAFLPIGTFLSQPLEDRFPPWTPAQGAPAGIIVLGGAIDPVLSAARGQIALNDEAERLTVAVKLARDYPNARIVFSGGNGDLIGGLPEGKFAAEFFESLGLPSNRIAIENQSRNTFENAVYTKRVVAPKPGERWLLVTSAMHMPRAVGVFRQIGFPIVPYPVDYQTTGRLTLLRIPFAPAGGIRLTDAAVHEWLGLCVYWMSGRTPALFPGPSDG
jgi:uncharacterized SAM-binding protein YcdF (DUF218 family)